MPHPATPATATHPSRILAVSPGQHLLTFLPQGTTLEGLQGTVEVKRGVLLCGQVLCASHRSLQAGQSLMQDEPGAGVWVRLENRGTGVAQVLWTDAPPAPSLLAWLWTAGKQLARGHKPVAGKQAL